MAIITIRYFYDHFLRHLQEDYTLIIIYRLPVYNRAIF
jgi:hypothetical protein